jgi:phosphinothricin acetyltransferase
VDVSVYVHPGHHRRGIGCALYTSLFALLRLQGFHSAHAGITMGNTGSIAMHEALGFRLVGVFPSIGYKMGAWHDVGWWRLPLRDSIGAPAPPLSLAEAEAAHTSTGDDGWARALAAGLPMLRP